MSLDLRDRPAGEDVPKDDRSIQRTANEAFPVGAEVENRKEDRAGTGFPQVLAISLSLGQADDLLPDVADFILRFLDILADAGADFDHRLVHFRLDAFGEQQLALLHDLGMNVRAEVARHGIDGLVFLLDSDTQAGSYGGHEAHVVTPERNCDQ